MAIQVTFKFAPGDQVFFLNDNEVVKGKVVHLQFNQHASDGETTRYTISHRQYDRDDQLFRFEKYVFGSKQNLIDSL